MMYVDVFIQPIPSACQCHPKGSVLNQCDSQTGQCQCAQRVQGKRCHECQYGYWNINSGVGCNKECACDPMGAYDDDCDDVSGQCRCKPGITGITCDQCLPGFWGFSPNGCTSKPKTLSNFKLGDLHILIIFFFHSQNASPASNLDIFVIPIPVDVFVPH